MARNEICRVGYDPFASPHDNDRPEILGGWWGDVKKAAKSAVKLHVAPVKAIYHAGKELSHGHVTGAANVIWRDTHKAMQAAGELASNPATTKALAAAAILFPPAAPAVAGIAVAARVYRALDSKDPKVREAARVALAATKAEAKKGSKAAQRTLDAMKAAKRMGRTAPRLIGEPSMRPPVRRPTGPGLASRVADRVAMAQAQLRSVPQRPMLPAPQATPVTLAWVPPASLMDWS